MEVRIAISKGYEKLKTYYSKTDNSHTYAIATSMFFQFFFVSLIYIYFTLLFFLNLSIVINPRFKLSYYRKQEWEQHYIEAAKKIFTVAHKSNAPKFFKRKVTCLLIKTNPFNLKLSK